MRHIALGTAIVLLTACGGGDNGSGPVPLGKPVITQVNGVTEPIGIVGMTVIIEGAELGDSARGKVYFRGAGGTRIQAPAARLDWTSSFIITSVPTGTADSSKVWVETTGGVSDSIPFTLITSGVFSPSNIAWSPTTSIPRALQGLGAVPVKVSRGSAHGSYVFTFGGADQANVAVSSVYRAPVLGGGGLGAWTELTALSAPRAYHAVAAATPSTARVDTTVAAYLYTLGGIDATGATVTDVQVARFGIDGTVGAWQSTTPLPVGLHSAGAVVFRGYVYVAGGSNGQNQPTAAVYRAEVRPDGTLGSWQSGPALPKATAYHTMVSFGPYVYVAGGDTGTVTPVLNTLSGSETNAALATRIDMRTGALAPWTPLSGMGKARSKGMMVTAGGAVLATSGIYAGQAGSSENTYATIDTDGMLASWNGATGSSTIDVVLGYALYNAAAVSFIDAQGRGHVMVLGGAKRSIVGQPSAAVVFY